MNPLPPFDPLGLPVHLAVLLGLAYLTLTLHLVAMQFTLGSLLLYPIARLRGQAEEARFLGTSIPLGFSYLATFGIPPLLFVQVVYGQFFYSSSVLVGAFWILVIPLLITAYGAAYAHKLTRERHPRLQPAILGVSLVAMLCIGFIYVNNLTLAQTPERWLTMYTQHPGGGTLNWGEPTLWPRFLLVLGPAVAVAGLALLLRGGLLLRWGATAAGRTSQQLGAPGVLVGVLLGGAGLGWLLAALPDPIRPQLLAGNLGPALVGGFGFLLLVTLLLAFVARGRAGLRLPLAAAHTYAFAIACLVVFRDQLRLEYLGTLADFSKVPVHAQWGMVGIFAVSLVVGLAFLIVLTVKVARPAAAARRAELDLASK